MKREAWYRFTFEDGYEVVTAAMTCDLARDLMSGHGKITGKYFVKWVDEGGEKNVAEVH